MRKIIILSAALWVSIFFIPANLFSEEISLKRIGNDIILNSKIKTALQLFEDGVESRSAKKIDDSVSQIGKIRDELHTENLAFITELLIKKGETLFITGEDSLGVHLLEEVRETFPSDYRPFFVLSRVYLSFGGLDPVSGIRRLWEGINVYLLSETRRGELRNFSVQVLLINLVITGYMVVLVFFSKHLGEAVFDLARIFHLIRGTPLFFLTATCFFILPVYTGGLPAFTITLSFLLWPYLGNLKERCVILGFTLLLAGLTLFHIENPLSRAAGDGYAEFKLEEFSKKSWDRETLTLVEKLIEENGDSRWLKVAEGLMYKWNGETDRSYAVFSRLLKKFPDDPDVLINMGNYSVNAGRFEEAKGFYLRALRINPGSAEARYNLSITLDALMEFESAREEFDKAYSLDSRMIQDFNKTRGTGGPVRPIDRMPSGNPPGVAGGRGVNSPELTALEILYGAVRCEADSVDLGMFAIFISVFLWLRRELLTRPVEECRECGTIFYKGSKCRLCTALMLPHSRVEPLERKKVVERLGNYHFMKKIFPLLFNLAAPGSGLIFKNRIVTGVSVLFGFVMALLLSLLCLLGTDAPVYTETALFLLAAYYLMANTFLLRDSWIWH